MRFETIRIDRDASGIARLTLDRAGKHNAMSAQMIAELTEAAAQLGADEQVRAVILQAEGRSFCAGGDLGWMQQQMAADAATRFAEARKLAMMLKALNEMPKPLIGRIHGTAFGGGVGLACVCDVALAAEGAKFGLTETRLGLIPATIGPYVIARMGEARVRRVFMSARIFDAAEATELGIVARTVPEEALDEAALAEARPYLATAPGAVAAAKALARRLGPPITDEIIDATIADLVRCWEGAEARDGVAAFFDKRSPPWAP